MTYIVTSDVLKLNLIVRIILFAISQKINIRHLSLNTINEFDKKDDKLSCLGTQSNVETNSRMK